MKITGTKTHFMNNLSKLLQKRLQIRLAGETVYDCSGESFSTYNDLWLTSSERLEKVEYGLANQMSGDDSGATTGDSQKVSDALMYNIFSNKQRMRLDYITQNHGLYAPHEMNHNFRYVITLSLAS